LLVPLLNVAVMQRVVPASTFAVTVIPEADSTNSPPLAPDTSNNVRICEQVNDTFIVIAVLPLATSTSPAASDAHVSQLPEPSAALFHWLTESILTDEF
jgi:hypothetical protein